MNKLACLIALMTAATAATSGAQEAVDWPEQKCVLYRTYWQQGLDGADRTQFNYAFIAGNENFIATGCKDRSNVICPRSNVELDIANSLTLAMMNSGAASTFLPFECPQNADASGNWQGPGL